MAPISSNATIIDAVSPRIAPAVFENPIWAISNTSSKIAIRGMVRLENQHEQTDDDHQSNQKYDADRPTKKFQHKATPVT